MRELTASPEAATAWREDRWRFAHRLGEELVVAPDTGRPIAGPALYGIWLPWGLLYVGQTLNASRRLRDLPVGESHHIANTFPPEIWDRVVVIAWSRLPEAGDLITRLGAELVGLALEYQMQLRTRPLANSARRTTSGGWRVVDPTRSKSRGARIALEVDVLTLRVHRLWLAAESSKPTPSDVVRVIRPGELISQSDPSDL